MGLWSEFLSHNGRTIHKWKHYFPAYDIHFSRYVNRPMTFVEIGCGEGGSLQMWKRFLGPHAQIVGIDIEPKCLEFEEDQISIRIGDQSDRGFLCSIIAEFGSPDVILDDGSHMMDHLMNSFHFMYPRMATNGVYMVEDLHTAYWPEYGGSLRHPASFIEFCKNMIDELNADWSGGAITPTDFTKSTQSIHFYDSLAVFERGRTLKKEAPRYPKG